MPKVPRVAVTFSRPTYDAIRALSDSTGDSMSALVAHFMDEAAPAFPAIIQAMAAAKARPVEALDLMAEQLAKAQAVSAQASLELVEMRRRSYKRRAKK